MAVRALARCRESRFVLSATVVAVLAIAVLGWAGPRSPAPARDTEVSETARPAELGATADSLGTTGSIVLPAPTLTLGVGVSPLAICRSGDRSCAAGTDIARVTLTANVAGSGAESWPAVDVAFVLETTPYDGVYDNGNGGEPGYDACAGTGLDPCESSNGVPFFAANAQAIANAIAAANPHTQVSFALVDYFATRDGWDDGDGAAYHVDVPSFVPAPSFGAAVQSSLLSEVLLGDVDYLDSDLADNFLHSSSITALYGTIAGSGLNWTANAHHVIVWMGSTAPRDPNYAENYCVSSHMNARTPYGSCYADTCEPSYQFSNGASPRCEGWIASGDGNATHSIAQFARSASQCTDSIGGVCTIDAIDYWDTPTDPYSEGWPAGSAWTSIGGGPGGSAVLQDSGNILTAGCAIATATGGSWDGPAYWTCPGGEPGTLQYVGPGPQEPPATLNPTLFNALKNIGFGPVASHPVASGTDHPLFEYVPFGSIALASDLSATAACERSGQPFPLCQTTPTIFRANGVSYLGWNWSTDRSTNSLFVRDQWTASFNVIATGPPYQIVPVDACVGAVCASGGSAAVGSLFTWASYLPASGTTAVTQSFPLGTVRVESSAAVSLGVPPPPPGVVPPPSAPAAPASLPVVLQFGSPTAFAFGQVSFQAIAAGFLGAGFLRVTIKNRAIALRVTANYGRVVSKYGARSMPKQSPKSRFE